jgi:hypothetical protein
MFTVTPCAVALHFVPCFVLCSLSVLAYSQSHEVFGEAIMGLSTSLIQPSGTLCCRESPCGRGMHVSLLYVFVSTRDDLYAGLPGHAFSRDVDDAAVAQENAVAAMVAIAGRFSGRDLRCVKTTMTILMRVREKPALACPHSCAWASCACRCRTVVRAHTLFTHQPSAPARRRHRLTTPSWSYSPYWLARPHSTCLPTWPSSCAT